MMSDEVKSCIILEFVGLRAKLYKMQIQGKVKNNEYCSTDIVTKQATKGIVKSLHERLTMDDFRRSLAYAVGEHALGEAHIYCPDKSNQAFIRSLRDRTKTNICVRQNTILSRRHNISTINTYKIALAAHDIKRCVLADNITTLPHGHYSLREMQLGVEDMDWEEGIEMVD